MRLWTIAAALFAAWIVGVAPAQAKVDIRIDLATQTMRVEADTGERYVWPVSSARQGFVTPRGVYAPQRLAKMHYSRKYHMSPMPHSIFFKEGWAIHGTNEARALGRPASHGCVRLSKENAATLFALVKQQGAVIAINGTPPHATMLASKTKKAPAVAMARSKTHGGDAQARLAKAAPAAPAALGYAPLRPAAPLEAWVKNPAAWSLR